MTFYNRDIEVEFLREIEKILKALLKLQFFQEDVG